MATLATKTGSFLDDALERGVGRFTLRYLQLLVEVGIDYKT